MSRPTRFELRSIMVLPDSLYQIPKMRSLSHPWSVVISSMLDFSCNCDGEGNLRGMGPACSVTVIASFASEIMRKDKGI